MIVFDDADLKNAVKGALMANFFTQVGRTQKDAFFDANGTNNKSIYTGPSIKDVRRILPISDPLPPLSHINLTK